jgi:hypothetical protein
LSQQEQQEKTLEKKDYLCGEFHHFKDCPYLIPEKQSEGWKLNPVIQECIEAKLQNPRLKIAVECAQISQKKDILENIFKGMTF